MITIIEPGCHFNVTGYCRNEVSSDTKLAVQLAEANADIDGGLGVLITRHDPLMCTVRLSPEVPYGRIYEQEEPN